MLQSYQRRRRSQKGWSYWMLPSQPVCALGSTGLHWVSLGFPGFHWVPLGSTGFLWVNQGALPARSPHTVTDSTCGVTAPRLRVSASSAPSRSSFSTLAPVMGHSPLLLALLIPYPYPTRVCLDDTRTWLSLTCHAWPASLRCSWVITHRTRTNPRRAGRRAGRQGVHSSSVRRFQA